MEENEKLLPFAAIINQFAVTLKKMSVKIEDSEMAMAVLNGVHDLFDTLFFALDAAHIDDGKRFLELVHI